MITKEIENKQTTTTKKSLADFERIQWKSLFMFTEVKNNFPNK
jgi:hypothetical protein